MVAQRYTIYQEFCVESNFSLPGKECLSNSMRIVRTVTIISVFLQCHKMIIAIDNPIFTICPRKQTQWKTHLMLYFCNWSHMSETRCCFRVSRCRAMDPEQSIRMTTFLSMIAPNTRREPKNHFHNSKKINELDKPRQVNFKLLDQFWFSKFFSERKVRKYKMSPYLTTP